MNAIEVSGTGVSPVRTEPHGQDARATEGAIHQRSTRRFDARFFWKIPSLILIMGFAVAGCASHKNNSKNDEQLRRAYAAGAAAAQMQIQQNQMQQPQIPPTGDPQVRILGAVKNPVLIWSEGLTLARALVLAEYQRNSAPSSITILRNNQPLQIDPQAVLNGADYPLFPGDIVYIQD